MSEPTIKVLLMAKEDITPYELYELITRLSDIRSSSVNGVIFRNDQWLMLDPTLKRHFNTKSFPQDQNIGDEADLDK